MLALNTFLILSLCFYLPRLSASGGQGLGCVIFPELGVDFWDSEALAAPGDCAQLKSSLLEKSLHCPLQTLHVCVLAAAAGVPAKRAAPIPTAGWTVVLAPVARGEPAHPPRGSPRSP